MSKSLLIKKAIPHFVAVVVFLLLNVIIYRPIIFENKIMDQNDINQGGGAAREIAEYREKTGEEALWTNSMFGGMPAYLISVQWSGSILVDNLQKLLTLHLPRPVGENFFAMLSFYIMLLAFGVRPYLAIGGAIAFGLSTFFIVSIQAGHMWKIRAIGYMPLVLAGIRLVLTKKYIPGFVLSAIALSLEINANHLQITYYLFILIALYLISELIAAYKEKGIKEFATKSVVLAVAGALAIGINFGKLWTTYEYGKYSIRGKSELSATSHESRAGLDRDYAFRWSSGKWESMTLLVPHLYGGGSGVYTGKNSELGDVLRRNNVPRNEINQYERAYLGYWGNQPGTAGPAYAGAVVCFLFILAFFFVDKKTKYWMVAGVALSIMLSWGNNFPSFNNLMFDVFPGYNKFRAVTMVIILALMIMPLMGFLGLEKLIEKGWTKETRKNLFVATGIAAFLALLALVVTRPPAVESVPTVLSDAIIADRKGIIRSDVFRTLFYVACSFGAIYLMLKSKISVQFFGIILALLIIIDLGLVDARYLNEGVYTKPSGKTFFTKTPADEAILRDTDLNYRVLNLQDPFNEARTSVFHKSVGGYHGAKMRRYQDLISTHLVTEMQQIIADQGLNKENCNVISMLNTRYILAGLQANAVIENPYANGAAWFVDQIQKVNTPDEEIAALGSVDLSRTAIIDQSKFNVDGVHADSAASITLVSYKPNMLSYEAATGHGGLAVFSDIYYSEGWRAFINGRETEIIRANYVLRALEIPAGKHKIEFVFEPASYFIGNKVMMASSGVLILVIAFGFYSLWQQRKADEFTEA